MKLPDLTQSCRLTRRNHFFILQVVGDTLITRFGKGTGSGGRQIQKQYETHPEALDAAADLFKSKKSNGYTFQVGASPQSQAHVHQPTSHPSTSPQQRRSNRKRRAPQSYDPTASLGQAKTNTSNPTVRQTRRSVKKQRRGLRGSAAIDTSSPLGVVDPASGIDGAIVSVASPTDTTPALYDAMLVLIDITKNHDKFIVLQLIYDQQNQKFIFYERYGRTGTAGQSLKLEYPHDCEADALTAFENKFLQKTGLDWQYREGPPLSGKYRFVKQDFQAKHDASLSDQPTWQYWVDDGVDGKTTGWYNYEQLGNALTEQLHAEFLNNAWLSQRVVLSGVYSYLVNLESMTQENVVHPNHTVRHIRRVPPNEIPNDEDPTDDVPDTTASKTSTIPVMTTRKTKPNVNIAVPKPSHKVVPAPAAKVPAAKKKPKKATKSEPVSVAQEQPAEIPVDDSCPSASDYHVVGDWDATMNQSNIMGGSNSNKYYRIQLLQHAGKKTYHVWTRWGRVGESRGTQTKLLGPFKEMSQAVKAFDKKFRDKTGNYWEQRDQFVPMEGKYELLEIDHSAKQNDDAEPLVMKITTQDENIEYLPSKLPKETAELVNLLFEKDVYTNAMKEFDIDIRRMPLGNLSVDQIEKGIAVLEEIEEELKGATAATSATLERLSSKFYTTLPHDFGRRRPPIISSTTMLQRSYDMCNVLKDMEKATSLMSEADEQRSMQKDRKKVPNPADAQYDSLNADLKLLDPESGEHKVVSKAYSNTSGHFRTKLLNIWKVDRKGEAERFKTAKIPNHMLLWHGSHIGAISAILATGLRIMPHSGGRVGRGIYLASENGKSQQYTTPAMHNSTGCMFLVEAALGKRYEIFKDDSTLQRAPNGYQSVHACGRQTPTGFCEVELDNVPVPVPVEAPGPCAKAAKSAFWQDEYLIYNEAQARIRYLITIK